jgi:hypothetical protein
MYTPSTMCGQNMMNVGCMKKLIWSRKFDKISKSWKWGQGQLSHALLTCIHHHQLDVFYDINKILWKVVLNTLNQLTNLFNFTLTSTNIPFEVMLCNLSFIFDHPIVCKTVKFTDQLDNRSWHVLRFYKVG